MATGTDIQFLKPAVNSPGLSTNGGRRIYSIIADATPLSLMQKVSASDRAAGFDRYYKMFVHAHDAANTGGTAGMFNFWNPTVSDDEIYWFPGTQTDTESGITGSEDHYGCGDLDSSALAAAATIDVYVENPAIIIFRDGETIYITDKADKDGSGNIEQHVINGVPVLVGNVATITLTGTLANAYSSTNTRVWSTSDEGAIAATNDADTTTSASGTFDHTLITNYNQGAVEQTITLNFTSATAYNVTSDVVAGLASGATGADYSPVNADTSTAYFTIPSTAFGGTFAATDTVEIPFHPADHPIWIRHKATAGIAAASGNQVECGFRFDE